MDATMNYQVCRGRFAGILGGTRKKKVRILQGESEQFGGKTHTDKLSGQPFVEGSQSTPQGPGRSDDNYFLQMPGLYLVSKYKGIESAVKPAKPAFWKGRRLKRAK